MERRIDVLEELKSIGVIPVIRLERAQDALPLGKSLLEGGLPCAEITFRTQAGPEAIGRLTAELPEFLVGAGTVLTVDQAERAMAAGARFVVSPGFDGAVVDACLDRGVPPIPGVATPTEIQAALAKGLRVLKFFPAEVMGGIRALKAFGEVYREVSFVPTGGVGPQNLAEYMRLSNVHACGGTWLATSERIARGEFAEIVALAQEAKAIVASARAPAA